MLRTINSGLVSFARIAAMHLRRCDGLSVSMLAHSNGEV